MNDVGFPVRAVVDGIEAADRAGLRPLKVNMVVRRGVNEDSVVPMARFARERGYILRFIEYMDVGHSNGWRLDEVVPAAEIVAIDRRRDAAGRPAPPSTRARSPTAGATATARARSASSLRHASRSARTARAPASPRRASSTRACSACAAPTCETRCDRVPTTTRCDGSSAAPGRHAPTATRSSAVTRRHRSRRSRCPASVAEAMLAHR